MTPAIKIGQGNNVTIRNNIFEGFETAIEADNVNNIDVDGNIIIGREYQEKLIAVLDELRNKSVDPNLIKDISILKDEIQKPKGNFETLKKYSKKILTEIPDVTVTFALSELLKKLFGL